MQNKPSEYAAIGGVDPRLITPFKRAMGEVARRTAHLSLERGVRVINVHHSHGGIFEYTGTQRHRFCKTLEGAGNKPAIAEWMYQNDGTGRTHLDKCVMDMARMGSNDCIAHGAMPAVFEDLVAAPDSEWFADERRAADFVKGMVAACESAKMSVIGGESAAMKYVVNARPPMPAAPELNGAVSGIIVPISQMVDSIRVQPGDSILGIGSSGMHSNGSGLVIGRAIKLPDVFLTKLPGGMTLGDSVLIPTLCYASFVEELLDQEADVHGLLPGTGGGVAKLASDPRPYNYRIHTWWKDEELPELFRYFRHVLGVSIEDCLTTFNWLGGYYVFVAKGNEDVVLKAAAKTGHKAMVVGIVEEGDRKVIFGPEGDLVLDAPDD